MTPLSSTRHVASSQSADMSFALPTIFMTETFPGSRDRAQVLQAAPHHHRPRFAIAPSPQESPQLGDPAHRLPHRRRALRRFRPPVHIAPQRPPFGRRQPFAGQRLGRLARRPAQRQNAPSHDQIEHQHPLQTRRRLQLPLLDPAAALEHFVQHFDRPALGIPADFLHRRCDRLHRQRGQQPPADGEGAWGGRTSRASTAQRVKGAWASFRQGGRRVTHAKRIASVVSRAG